MFDDQVLLVVDVENTEKYCQSEKCQVAQQRVTFTVLPVREDFHLLIHLGRNHITHVAGNLPRILQGCVVVT